MYDDGPNAPRTPADEVRRLYYTTFPTNYVDENSTVDELLWQLVLEARSMRLVIILCTIAVILALLLIVVGCVLILTG